METNDKCMFTVFLSRAMLAMGKSKSWPHALETMTGNKEMSVAPIKEYFQPLQDWLVNERCSKKYKIGWPGQPADGVSICTTPSTSPTSMKQTTDPNGANSPQSCLVALLFCLIGVLLSVA